MMKRRMGSGLIVAGTGEGSMAWLPAKAGETLVVDTILLVVSIMVTCKTEYFFRPKIGDGEMVYIVPGGIGILQDGRRC